MNAIRFFAANAGFAHAIGSDPEDARIANGLKLALAEEWAREVGMTFEWHEDTDTDSSDFSDEEPAWTLWQCVAKWSAGGVADVLGGVDFGRDGTPQDSEYARVVAAELAFGVMPQLGTLQTQTDANWYAGGVSIRTQDGKELARVRNRKGTNTFDAAALIAAAFNIARNTGE